MNKITYLITTLLLSLYSPVVFAQFQQARTTDSGMSGGMGNRRGGANRSGDRDTTSNKEIPRGITVWTVDELSGDRIPAEPDTTSYLRMNYALPSGVYGEFTGLGNNGSTRYNRIFIDRHEHDDFIFTNGYSQVIVHPHQFHFTNTYSPISNIEYNECGNKMNGEDHLKALFAANFNKRLGFGFKFDYLYARGYYANQSTSHFDYTMWGSYLGSRYQAHILFSTNHQKQAENGGITNDDYIKHPELFSDNFSENEIPTVLSSNWNRNHNSHIFFTHRYNVGFNRRVPMTEKEIEAKKFAMQAAQEKAEREARAKAQEDDEDENDNYKSKRSNKNTPTEPKGRPKDAKVIGNEPDLPKAIADTTRIAMTTEQAKDSLLAEKTKNEDDLFMKDEYVPVTSFFHTLNLDNYSRSYIAKETPDGYYKYDYFKEQVDTLKSAFTDEVDHLHMTNTLGIAMLEGFNKWMKAGIKLFGRHELKHFSLPLVDGSFEKWSENNIILGANLSKQEGKTLHFNATGQFVPVGTDIGQIELDGNIDLNFPLLGDTVRLEAGGFFTLLNPSAFLTKYHVRHFQWDEDLSKVKHVHLEGNLSIDRTDTRLRVAVDNLTDYVYLGTSYTIDKNNNRKDVTLAPRQASNIQIYTAQLYQNLKMGIIHWDNVITFQQTSAPVELPLPKLNIYSTLYLRFKIARVLATDFGVDVRYFTKYNAPEYSPQMQSFVIQENEAIRAEVGNYPFCNVYANFQLKSCRFFIMMSHVNCSGKGNYFMTPHYPENGRVLRFGLNWNFYN